MISALGAVPVQRAQDVASVVGRSASADNSQLFKASVEALEHGRCLLLFPEGVSYTSSRMQPLKTGAARVVQEFEIAHPGQRVGIVPCEWVRFAVVFAR